MVAGLSMGGKLWTLDFELSRGGGALPRAANNADTAFLPLPREPPDAGRLIYRSSSLLLSVFTPGSRSSQVVQLLASAFIGIHSNHHSLDFLCKKRFGDGKENGVNRIGRCQDRQLLCSLHGRV